MAESARGPVRARRLPARGKKGLKLVYVMMPKISAQKVPYRDTDLQYSARLPDVHTPDCVFSVSTLNEPLVHLPGIRRFCGLWASNPSPHLGDPGGNFLIDRFVCRAPDSGAVASLVYGAERNSLHVSSGCNQWVPAKNSRPELESRKHPNPVDASGKHHSVDS